MERVKAGQKKHTCFYCKDEFTQIIRHVEQKHAEKELVSELAKARFDKDTRRVKSVMNRIRNLGQDAFNIENATRGIGEIRVNRQAPPNSKKNYETCPQCHGCFVENSRHKCEKQHVVANETAVERMFKAFRNDEVTLEIRKDATILAFAGRLCEKYPEDRYFVMIRQRLRKLGRFLIAIKKSNDRITGLKSVFHTANYDSILAAFVELSERADSLPMDLYPIIIDVGDMLVVTAIQSEEVDLQTQITHFLQVFKFKYGATFNFSARRKLKEKKRQKKISLPLTSDIKKTSNSPPDDCKKPDQIAQYGIL